MDKVSSPLEQSNGDVQNGGQRTASASKMNMTKCRRSDAIKKSDVQTAQMRRNDDEGATEGSRALWLVVTDIVHLRRPLSGGAQQ